MCFPRIPKGIREPNAADVHAEVDCVHWSVEAGQLGPRGNLSTVLARDIRVDVPRCLQQNRRTTWLVSGEESTWPAKRGRRTCFPSFTLSTVV